jgi:hypothetical protein
LATGCEWNEVENLSSRTKRQVVGVHALFWEVITMYDQFTQVQISITNDGETIDAFTVSHWKSDDDADENVGSHASESLLIERIRRYIKKKP